VREPQASYAYDRRRNELRRCHHEVRPGALRPRASRWEGSAGQSAIRNTESPCRVTPGSDRPSFQHGHVSLYTMRSRIPAFEGRAAGCALRIWGGILSRSRGGGLCAVHIREFTRRRIGQWGRGFCAESPCIEIPAMKATKCPFGHWGRIPNPKSQIPLSSRLRISLSPRLPVPVSACSLLTPDS